MSHRHHWAPALLLAGLVAASGCAQQSSAAEAVYVKPGDKDTHYAFLSGGHSGQVYVHGLPSGRLINQIAVFSPYAKTGYGFDEESKAMMGEFQWGDAHHPGLSETNGDYDGRWLFINDMPNARIARIDLTTFETAEILGPLPNVSALHAGPYITPNSDYVFGASRFSIPMDDKHKKVENYATDFDGVLAGVKVAKDTGKMALAWQVKMPPMDFDKADSGKGPLEGWQFFTSYNTELANTKLEINASQHDQDFITALNWKAAQKAVDEGKYTMVNGAKVIDPAKTPGVVYFIPCPKSPHGVDVSPDGKYVVGSGKLAPVAAVFSAEKMLEAIEKKDFDGNWRGIPVLRYKTVNVAEVPVGLGPLHTQFDDKGYAYTSLFVDSAIAKWQIGSWKVVDKIPVTYNVGHLAAAEGDTAHPKGKYLLSLNKMTKDRFLGTGADYPTNAQLIDISGEKMKLLLDFPTIGEPHYGQIIEASKVKPQKIYDLAKSTKHGKVMSEKEVKVTRTGPKAVEVKMITIRTHFTPDIIKVKQGDTVTFHVTNIEQDENASHGFAINRSNVDVELAPGNTKTVIWKADKAGVFPFYCSQFCSALHQEMQGYIEVEPRS
jgi:nitrous-oxide reductase